ncbi:FAD-dependent oxidoreductase [Moorena producens JHB]|uniref:FAD-dependent oxidoreductase n=1 Tax=Moorena producens (strain JHB) TaxID=1454205 RepID=A0A1D9G8C8_MOOP1|nr:FAD-dependent oxidoreductase [Moorena producens]AOY83784.1 FAD-dependent oxidoreductase [Moorena producens JHB]
MSKVAIIGCGIVGAAIAYELSRVNGLSITVLDQHLPAQGSTGAALGVLMGAISKKVKGRAWQLRQVSIQRYQTLIPELEALTGYQIPVNRNGILKLCLPGEDLASWEKLLQTRLCDGWQLEIWDVPQVKHRCPQLSQDKFIAGIYSPQDLQIDPTALTQVLVAGAEANGVRFNFGITVKGFESIGSDLNNSLNCSQISTDSGTLEIDWLVVAAGLGSSGLIKMLQPQDLQVSRDLPLTLKPVLGQGVKLRLPQPMGYEDFQPVITRDDVHILPVGKQDYWVGATVEFPDDAGNVEAQPALLEVVRQNAIAFCPALATAEIIHTWYGLRPRPEGRPAPVIDQLPGYNNVWLATGHYRNGVLLAPATAQIIREEIIDSGK